MGGVKADHPALLPAYSAGMQAQHHNHNKLSFVSGQSSIHKPQAPNKNPVNQDVNISCNRDWCNQDTPLYRDDPKHVAKIATSYLGSAFVLECSTLLQVCKDYKYSQPLYQ